jgi:hypothetical protein
MDDRLRPLGFVVAATFLSGLVWLYALRAALPLP